MTRRRSTRSDTCRAWPAPWTGTAALSSRTRPPPGSGTGRRQWSTRSGARSVPGRSSWRRICRSGTRESSLSGATCTARTSLPPARALPPLDSTFLSVDEPMRSILTIDLDGTSYVLAGGEGHPASERSDSAERYRRLGSFARDRLGADEIAYRWSTQDAMPADGLPYVGLMSTDARHIHVITGLRKWGLTNGTAAALILRDTLCGRHNPWAAVFDSTRVSESTPAAAAPDAAPAGTGDATAPASRGARRCPGPGGPAPGKQLPGEGRVVDVDGAKTAVYRQPGGRHQRRVGRLHPPGLHRGVQPGRRDLGLPLPRLPVQHRRHRHPGPRHPEPRVQPGTGGPRLSSAERDPVSRN